MLNHIEKNSKILLQKNYQLTTPFARHPQTRRSKTANIAKHDITSQHSDILAMCCI